MGRSSLEPDLLYIHNSNPYFRGECADTELTNPGTGRCLAQPLAFAEMVSGVGKCTADLNRICKEVETKCAAAIGNAEQSLNQTASDITAFSQKLNSLGETVDATPQKAHSLVSREIDNAKVYNPFWVFTCLVLPNWSVTESEEGPALTSRE